MKKGNLIQGNYSSQVRIHDRDHHRNGWSVISNETNWKPMVVGNRVGKWKFFYEDGVITTDYPRAHARPKFYCELPEPEPILRPRTKVSIECEIMPGVGDTYLVKFPNDQETWMHKKHFKAVKQPFAIGDEVLHGHLTYTIKGIDGDVAWCLDAYDCYDNFGLYELEHV